MIKDLKQVAAYLDDVVVFDSDPIAHVQTIFSCFERIRKQNLKLFPSKARLGATDANFLGHSISPAGLRPNAEKVSALVNTTMPPDVKRPSTDGRYHVLPQFFARLVREAPSE